MTYSRALPEAMGYTVTMDDSAGYGVTRMLIMRDGINPDTGGTEPRRCVWNPRDNSEQCFEVLAWIRSLGVDGYDLLTEYERSPIFQNNGTPAGLRAAIVEAAERVANG